jgi:hypothetical protein
VVFLREMSMSVLATVSKSVAAGGAAVTLFDLSWWSVATALIGAAASYHFESEQKPTALPRLLFGISATAFCAALAAAAAPQIPGLAWAGGIDIAIRAGLLGVSVRALYEQGRRILGTFRAGPKT